MTLGSWKGYKSYTQGNKVNERTVKFEERLNHEHYSLRGEVGGNRQFKG